MDYLMVKLYHWKWFFSIIFGKLHEIFKFSIKRMIRCYLLEFSFFRYFHDKIMSSVFSYIYRHLYLLWNKSCYESTWDVELCTSHEWFSDYSSLFFITFHIFLNLPRHHQRLWINTFGFFTYLIPRSLVFLFRW